MLLTILILEKNSKIQMRKKKKKWNEVWEMEGERKERGKFFIFF